MLLATQMAFNADVALKRARANVALQASWVINLIVHRNTAVGQELATGSTPFHEEVQVIMLAIHLIFFLIDCSLLSERDTAMEAEEAGMMKRFASYPGNMPRIDGFVAVFTALSIELGKMNITVRLTVVFEVATVLKRFMTHEANEVLRMVIAPKCLNDISRIDLSFAVTAGRTDFVNVVRPTIEASVFLRKFLTL